MSTTARTGVPIKNVGRELKRFTQGKAEHGMNPVVIRNAFAKTFSLESDAVPDLLAVQNHASCYLRKYLSNHDELEDTIDIIGAIKISGLERSDQPFTFGYDMSLTQRPEIGCGTVEEPLLPAILHGWCRGK